MALFFFSKKRKEIAQVGLGEDPHSFIHYYESQVGGNLPGFYGAVVMYGHGIGSLFSRSFALFSLQ